MLINKPLPEYTIQGECSFFACRYCRVKYGREHQPWCELLYLTAPTCINCQYYRRRTGSCLHPALKKQRKDGVPREKNKGTFRGGRNS